MNREKLLIECFGKTIRRKRNLLNLTQEELSFRSSVNEKHIGEIERGNSDPQFSTIAKLARGLNLELDELFSETLKMYSHLEERE